jgi:AhpD family alkylhydroperoxidase
MVWAKSIHKRPPMKRNFRAARPPPLFFLTTEALSHRFDAYDGGLPGGPRRLPGLERGPRRRRAVAELREQIALAVGEANGCQYCVSAHTAIGKRLGVAEAELEASREGAAGDPKVEAALGFARALVERRGDVTDADVARVREAGWNDAEVAEIVAHVALNVFTNYFNITAGTEIDFPKIPLGTAGQ